VSYGDFAIAASFAFILTLVGLSSLDYSRILLAKKEKVL
jgi:hypothetical protein